MDVFTTKHIGDLFNISPQTVKNWCKEFEDYLSPSATPESGQARQFTENDLRVFALVADMRNKRHSVADIHATLGTGERGEIPSIPSRMPALAPEQMLQLQSRITGLEAQLREAEDRSKEYEGQVTLLKEQLKEARQEIRNLYRQIAQLEVEQDQDDDD